MSTGPKRAGSIFGLGLEMDASEAAGDICAGPNREGSGAVNEGGTGPASNAISAPMSSEGRGDGVTDRLRLVKSVTDRGLTG